MFGMHSHVLREMNLRDLHSDGGSEFDPESWTLCSVNVVGWGAWFIKW